MNKFICGLVVIALAACTHPYREDQYFESRIRTLEMRIDSLEMLLLPDQEKRQTASGAAKPHIKKKKGTANASGSSYSTSGASSSGYCHGITKKGRGCLRRVRSGLYCWQHGG